MKQGHCNQVAAVILNYRRADLTTRCVASLSGQVSLALVVDNSGHEEETQRLAECMAVLATHGEKTDVEVIDPGENLGFGRGVDYGLRRLIERGVFECVLVINNRGNARNAAGTKRQRLGRRKNGGQPFNFISLVSPAVCAGSATTLRWCIPLSQRSLPSGSVVTGERRFV